MKTFKLFKHCQRCVLPSTFRNIEFDRQGICNYCRAYEQYRLQLTDWPALEKLLAERFDKFRGKHEYDCLVGISGGKDSSYILYVLKKVFNLYR